jgi:hypothetical protein
MKKITFFLTLSTAAVLMSCNSKNQTNSDSQETEPTTELLTTSSMVEQPIFSFAFVGCNRVNYKDKIASVPSAANLPVLERIFADLDSISPQPELLFFLGDMVEGENTLGDLNTQLNAWVKRYTTTFERKAIELVAVPGNHELLHYGSPEYPLKGATDVWMKYMTPYMPADREIIKTDSLNNRATFSFVRHKTAFVVMNTDTYNESAGGKVGVEGLIAFNWIKNQIETYRKDSTVDHIFVLGHKPAYFDGAYHKGHSGFPDSEKIWSVLRNNEVTAMLSAHQHCYYRGQPEGDSTYQIVAGNGGSSRDGGTTPPKYFGYSVIHVYANQSPRLESIGFQPGVTYNGAISTTSNSLPRDTTVLMMNKNPNTGFGQFCE